MRVGYLGPEGTFTEQAASALDGERVGFATVHDVASGRWPVTVEEALLVLLLGSAAMLQYHVRTMRGRGPRRVVKALRDSMPRQVTQALSEYEGWTVSDPGG